MLTAIMFVALIQTAPQANELVLEFNVTTKLISIPETSKRIEVDKDGKVKELPQEKTAKATPPVKPVVTKMTIGLGANYFLVDRPNHHTLYDFPKTTVTNWNDDKKEYDQTSIYALVLFRGMELQNRQYLKKVLQEAKINSKSDDSGVANEHPRELEALFGILIGEQEKPKVKQRTEGSMNILEIDGKVAVRYEPSTVNIPNEYLETYKLWLAHETQIHPAIRDYLVQTKVAPKKLIWLNQSSGIVEFSLDLIEATIKPVRTVFNPKSYQLRHVKETPVNIMLAKAADRIANYKKPSQQEREAAMEKANQAGKSLDILLIVIDQGLSETKSTLGKALAKYNINQNQDQDLRNFVQVLGNQKSPEESIAILNALDRKGLTHGHILETQLGSMKMNSPKKAEATQHYLNAIEANPCLTGAYIDLGKILQSNYQTVEAWKCWELARSIAPDHQMVQSIRQFEMSLLKRHPEFFLSDGVSK